ncbi:wax ester/triacylglycerol synthase domain-containing protein [Nocardia halotolerans]|uniref:Wax ester/triacylglycerol synthase domain-containing protein n=1 Tax=Nocardia halotolerans TaxID=1755878 RepID=A0ABV8VKX4_9NOCA
MTTMAARDATMFWLSRRTVNDVFLLYCFAESPATTDELRAFTAARADGIADLRIRAREIAGGLDYPRWEPVEFAPQQFIEHRPAAPAWHTVLTRVGELLGTGLDATEHPWRIHVFRGVRDAPGSTGPSLVAVVQLSHALADGTRAAALARSLFAPEEVVHNHPAGPVDNFTRNPSDPAKNPLRPVDYCAQICGWFTDPRVIGALRFPRQLVRTVRRGRLAHAAQRELLRRGDAGEIPPAATGFDPCALNPAAPVRTFDHRVRMLVLDVGALRVPGHTVTVVALTAISRALATYLAERGQLPRHLGTAVPMALPAPGTARNNYRGLSIDLHIEEPDLRIRADRIAEELAIRRERALNPLLAAQDRVGETVPALFTVRDVERADLDTVPPAVDGNTVVSSVYRGAADLSFAGAPVRFTGGFPALGTVMHLTHGVHGIGETVALSVHSDLAVIADPDRYLELLAESVPAVVAASTG